MEAHLHVHDAPTRMSPGQFDTVDQDPTSPKTYLSLTCWTKCMLAMRHPLIEGYAELFLWYIWIGP